MQLRPRVGELGSRMLNVNEVAYLLHVHPSKVRRWEHQGQLKSYRIGSKGAIRFKIEDVSQFINFPSKKKRCKYFSVVILSSDSLWHE